MAEQAITENHKKIDAILLDRMMPDMDGIDVVKWMNSNKKISTPPIIMLTVLDRPEQVKEGIDEGVFYYLTKPIQEPVLKSVVSSAVRESKQHKLLTQELERHRNGFKLLDNASFKVHTLDEADDVACFIANSFPEPSKILPGIAALDNHGRGIARANMIFDSLEYNKQGNQVSATVDKTDKESFTW